MRSNSQRVQPSPLCALLQRASREGGEHECAVKTASAVCLALPGLWCCGPHPSGGHRLPKLPRHGSTKQLRRLVRCPWVSGLRWSQKPPSPVSGPLCWRLLQQCLKPGALPCCHLATVPPCSCSSPFHLACMVAQHCGPSQALILAQQGCRCPGPGCLRGTVRPAQAGLWQRLQLLFPFHFFFVSLHC